MNLICIRVLWFIFFVASKTVRGLDRQSNIVGGNYARKGEFPQTCQIQVDGSECGCTVVALKRIVTAAVCFVSIVNGTRIERKLNEAKAFFGTVKRLGTDGQVSKVLSYKLHKDFRRRQFRGYMHNYAMARLETPLKFNDNVQPMNLYSTIPSEFKYAWEELTLSKSPFCTVIGWGPSITDNSSHLSAVQTKFMKKIEVIIGSEEECWTTEVKPKDTMIPYGEICVKSKLELDYLWEEDLGTPLVCGDYVWALATGIIYTQNLAIPYFYLLHWNYIKDFILEGSGSTSLFICNLLIFLTTSYSLLIVKTVNI